jgi:hypothetical protein
LVIKKFWENMKNTARKDPRLTDQEVIDCLRIKNTLTSVSTD